MAMTTQTVPLSKLRPLPRNRRKHGERNLAEIEASLLAHGQVEPLIVQKSTGCIIAGNGRFAVMARLGMETAEVVFLDVDDARASQLAIRLNRTAELAEWDDALREEVERLCDEGLSVADLGFAWEEVAGPPAPDESKAELVDRPTKGPPEMAWVLIGIPTIRYGELAEAVETFAAVPGVLCETSVGNAVEK